MIKNLYLHVPFCSSICHYCDFKRSIYQSDIVDQWLHQIKKELAEKNVATYLETIYLGGGTPSCLSLKQLQELFLLLEPYTNYLKEYTMESNVESLTRDKILLCKKVGINRISLGIQSLQSCLLKVMNRKHTKKEALDKIKEIYANGIHNISIDLIYGLEGQSLTMWKKDLFEIIDNPYISHISLYSLTIEEGSVFYRMNKKTVANEVEAQMYQTAIEILAKNHFVQYEVANFARDKKVSLHNQAYWRYDDFYGIGIGASGKEGCIRYEHCGTINAYIKDESVIVTEELTKEDQMFENIMMSLRMRKGIALDEFEKRYHVSMMERYQNVIEEGIKEGSLLIEDNHLRVTTKGMFYLHDVLLPFMD